MYLPDYRGGSIVNLMSSIGKARGARMKYKELRLLPAKDIRNAKSIVLINVDGLGYEFLKRRCKGSSLERHCMGRMTSVFPSTTAAATTCFSTGSPAQQHGMTGWFMFVKELGEVIIPLPFVTRMGHNDLRHIARHRDLFDITPFADRIRTASYTVMPADLCGTPFTKTIAGRSKIVPCVSLAAMGRSIAALTKRRGRKYVYAYIPTLDHESHERGTTHPGTLAEFRRIDATFTRLVASVAEDTVLIVTADHGEKDIPVKGRVALWKHPRLQKMLLLPLCAEPRLAFCYVRPDKRKEFERYVRTRLRHCCTLRKSQELVDKGWFGLFRPHRALSERIGDYTLIMKEGYAIRDRLLGEERHFNKADHGGVSKEEMRVPLIIART